MTGIVLLPAGPIAHIVNPGAELKCFGIEGLRQGAETFLIVAIHYSSIGFVIHKVYNVVGNQLHM